MKRVVIRYLLTCLIIILSLCLWSGCLYIETPSPPSPEPSPPPADTATPIEPNWTPPPVEGQTPTLPDIASVVALVKPSVVAINTEYVTYDIFNRPYKQEGAGSGWIIDEDGLIVTNNHVVTGAESVTVTLIDGRTFPAQTIRTDWLSDLAVVKVSAQNLPAAKVGNSAMLRVGDWVVAIGNSLGLGISATKGIVSATGVSVSVSAGQTLHDLVQTDAAINPGNSGGPLVNMAGEVIGITSVKLTAVEVEGIGYAISSKTAMLIIEQLIQNGYVVRPWLGVVLYTIDQYAVLRYNLAVDKGVLVTEVAIGSPADEAGIEPGDVITKFGAEEIANADELIEAIHSTQIGQRVEIIFWRGETKITTHAILTESPPPS
ncbi:MAG: trypsin-like peptidase domain-containing protein [Dehalococcoidia bacterium]|nr:trypsin-like peptidase domain-containing protein [Dehalococcoidia bacterium]